MATTMSIITKCLFQARCVSRYNPVFVSGSATHGSGLGTVGISNFAKDQLGEVVYWEVNSPKNSQVKAGEVIGNVESVKSVSDIISPVQGEIAQVNGDDGNQDSNEVLKHLNSDPESSGWLVKLKLTPSIPPSSTPPNLLTSKQYQDYLNATSPDAPSAS